MLIAGIDEAGRGPCLGPMVLAVTSIEKSNEEKLIELGVKDSKLLSPKERQRQYSEIKKLVKEFFLTKITAEEIDSLRDRKSLNEVEAMRAGFLLNSLKRKPEVIYVDSPDILSENFGKRIKKYISFDAIIKSEHKADVNYPIVSAASVIAKVERDREIEMLSKKYGDIGTGYPGDEDTIKFIKNYLHQFKSLPAIARKSWLTNQRILDERFQKKLFELGKNE